MPKRITAYTTDQRLLLEIRDHLVALPLAKELKHQDVEAAKKLRREIDELQTRLDHNDAVIKLLSRAAGIDPEALSEDELEDPPRRGSLHRVTVDATSKSADAEATTASTTERSESK